MRTGPAGIFAVFVVTLLGGIGTVHGAQPFDSAQGKPTLQNARVSTSHGRDIAREIAGVISSTSEQPTWVGWSVPTVDGRHDMCCHYGNNGDRCCGACALEGTRNTAVAPDPGATSSRVVRLERPPALVVMVRIADKRVERIKVFSESCVLDAGGTSVLWLAAVTPTDSLGWLQSHLRSLGPTATASTAKESERQIQPTVMAISLHAGAEADRALVEAARQHASPKVRGAALFWLAQKAGQAAAATISDAIERDPETEVKKRAVFALSQLPKDEGVPRLIDVARTHSNPAVRRQAMFWLGQSRDPRAISFFEQVLNVR